jgi:uncharacterized protein
MELAAVSKNYNHFYVPAFSVRIGEKDLVRDLGIAVNQVEVDRSLSAAGRFAFTVVNGYNFEKQRFVDAHGGSILDVLKFGALVEIAIGYRDYERLPVLLTGMITEIGTGFSDSGSPELSVAGYDHSFPMMLGKRSQSWSTSKDSDTVRKLASHHNLAADVTETKLPLPQIEQNQESDLEFLKKIAQRNHYEFYVDEKRRLHFGPPRDREAGIVQLKWGQGLMSFKPEANLAAQVSEVHVYGWSEKRKEVIVGKAVAGDESGKEAQGKSGGEVVRAAIGKPAVLEVRLPVDDAADAKRRAQAILNDHAKRYLTGEAECLGLPELLPDRNVTLLNLGATFSKTYYIQQSVHKVDTSGYRTRVKVKEPSA